MSSAEARSHFPHFEISRRSHEASRAIEQARLDAAEAIRQATGVFAQTHAYLLPDSFVVASEKPSEGKASIFAHWSLISYNTRSNKLFRLFFIDKPEIENRQGFGEQLVEGSASHIDTYPTAPDQWLNYGNQVLEGMVKIALANDQITR